MTDAWLPDHDHAAAVAEQAAARAKVSIAELGTSQNLAAASGLIDRVWGRASGAGPLLPAELLTALAHAGNQVSGAWRDDELVGVTAAFLGRAGTGVFLHSHVTGVDPDHAGRGIGRALKWHQRAWALARGIREVRWTFDPTIRRNAVMNLIVLAARPLRFLPDHYGTLADARNRGVPSDRLLVSWELGSPRVRTAAAGRTASPDLEALRRSGAEVVLDVGPDGGPRTHPDHHAPRRLVQVPADIEALRRSDPARARAWSTAVRTHLGGALDAGARVSGATRDGWYVLSLRDGLTELGGPR